MTTPPETNATAWSAPTLISLANADHSDNGSNPEASEALNQNGVAAAPSS